VPLDVLKPKCKANSQHSDTK